MRREPLADELVGIVMTKLAAVYGKRFSQGYNLSMEDVRAHWAHELAGVSEAGILYALAHLPSEYVPNVLQFRALAANRPVDSAKALEAPRPSPTQRARFLASLRGLRDTLVNQGRTPTLAWAERIMADPAGYSRYARELAAQALREKGRLP